MKKFLPIILLSLSLSGCFGPNRLYLAEALGSFDLPEPEITTDDLKGTSLSDGEGYGLSVMQAQKLFQQNRGKPVHYLGILERAQVKGNTAEIEVLPVRIGYAKQKCELRSRNLPTSASDCVIGGKTLVSVTCRINDWASLNQKTGGDILNALKVRFSDRKSSRGWPAIHLEGTLAEYITAKKAIATFNHTTGLDYGPRPGFSGWTHTYKTFVVKDCAVRGYKLKVVG